MKTLHFRGSDPYKLSKKSIAVVGSRRMTRYGTEVVDKFVSCFVANGIVTISGFMYGVDTSVHQKTVDYGGKTIAVFGCGLNVIYPPENKNLYEEIVGAGGSVVSEYDDDAKPHLWKFPQRNKIVAGLSSLGVLVIEAGEKSGSLITAELGRKLGKKVYAVPGSINSPVSAGCNWLIKKGRAILVTKPEDIIGGSFKIGKNKIADNLNKTEQKIIRVLENESLTIDEIATEAEENIIEIGKEVSIMAIKGLIIEAGGKYYVKRN